MIFEKLNEYEHEQVMFVQDKSVGLRAIIAVHNTVRGPALGGTRFFDYASEEDALFDVLRLSRGMTLKNAAAGLNLGGGKAVIIGDSKKLKSREFLNSYGRFIDSLGGKYYTAEDVNISSQDVAHMNETTKYVVGTPEVSGDPGPFTARGVYMGMKAGAKEKFGTDSLAGKTIAIQGIGSVGGRLCKYLAEEGAKLIISDVNSAALQKVENATVVSPEEIVFSECDIFAPCAMGAVLNVNNVGNLKCKLIAGAANNVLLDIETGDKLTQMGILYLPDYIVNAGGVINCGMEVSAGHYDVNAVNAKVDEIYQTTQKIISLAKEKNIGTHRAADEYAYAQIN
ncbi:MAG: leucine dehydrogenase [Clostridiales bacterium]|jgi:leucine dehydrogenase|nr:leucine dehydrogenase [Clostridiales bacterium]